VNIVKNSTSNRSNTGYTGISLRDRVGRKIKYQAQIKVKTPTNWISLHIGNFDTLEEAIQARVNFIKSLL